MIGFQDSVTHMHESTLVRKMEEGRIKNKRMILIGAGRS